MTDADLMVVGVSHFSNEGPKVAETVIEEFERSTIKALPLKRLGHAQTTPGGRKRRRRRSGAPRNWHLISVYVENG